MTSTPRPAAAPDLPRYADELAEELEEIGSARPERPDRPEDRFLDREASWLDYSDRVLTLAADPAQPLLERVRFAAIFAGNLVIRAGTGQGDRRALRTSHSPG